MDDLDKYWVDPNQPGSYVHMNWYGPNADYQNPYFTLRQDHNRDVKDRLFGMVAANFTITDHITLKLKQGLDFSSIENKFWRVYNDPVFVSNSPEMEISRSTSRETNSEALASYNNQFGDFSVGVSVGGNIMHSKSEGNYSSGTQFPLLGAQYVALGTTQEASNSIYEKQINSVYGFTNIGYKDWLYLDLTARNDWSSTLPSDNRSYFYPSVSLSALLTGAADAYGINYNHNVIDYGKVRFSFAQVGKDTDPYQLLTTYGTTSNGGFDLLYAYIDDNAAIANADLKPEIATSYEVGTEWHFFKNRLGLDFTYYNTQTKNQVMRLTQVQTSGARFAYDNVGKISNKGIELQLNGEFVRTRDFQLGATVNFAHNVSKVDELTDDISMYSLGQLTGVSSTFQVIAQEGERLGQLYDYGYLRDDNGNIVVGDDGLPKRSDTQIVLGDIQPDFSGSFNVYANWKNLSFNALFNFQKGGDIFSATEYKAAIVGTAERTGDRNDFVVKGVTENGTVNTTSVTAENYWRNANIEEFIYDASFLKLQEASITYTFNRDFLHRHTNGIIDSAQFSIYGSNLFYLDKKTPGTTPDGSSLDTSMLSQALDLSPIPNTRTFGFSLKVGF